MKTKALIICVVLGFLVLVTRNTLWAGDRFTHRQVKQGERIKQGVRRGEITDREFIRLNREQHRIQNTKRRALADTRITPHERRRLHGLQRRASDHIYLAKHNRVSYHRGRALHRHHICRHWPRYHTCHVCGRISQPCYSFGWSFVLR